MGAAPARDAGKVMLIRSWPNMFVLGRTEVGMISVVVVPLTKETFVSVICAERTPVRYISSLVGTCVPVLSAVVTWKGPVTQPEIAVLVTLQTIAVPPASFVEVKMSGCAPT